IKKIPSHPLRFGTAYRANFLDDFESSIGEEGIKLFRQSIFGHYLDMPNCNFQGQIIKCLLLLEVDQKNKEELHIRHVQGNILRFTINDFAIITGLRCTGNMNDFKYSDDQASRLLSLYFPGAKNGVNKARFVERFLVGGWKTNEDAVQMAILYFIHTFVFSQLGDAPISVDDFKMVEDGSYEQYPWGKLAYSKLIKGMRQEFSNAKQMYRLGGMPYALNVWIYECASQVPSEIAVRVGNKIPRILNWRVIAVKPKFETFMSTIFSEYPCSNIVQSQHEMESIVVHDSQQKPEDSTSAAKVNFRKPHEVTGFEDFSTTPPTEFLKRSRDVAETSSPPPSKRMKTSPAKKPIQVETANMHKNFIPPNESENLVSPDNEPLAKSPKESEKPVSPDNVPGAKSALGGESSGHSDRIIHMQFKVDRKFKRLENKMDSNHIDLLKAIDSMANRMTGTSSQVKKDDFDQSFHVVEQQEAPTGLEVDNISEQSILADVPELFDQQVYSDTLKEDEPSVKDVSAHQMEPQRADTDQLIADSDTLQNTVKKDGRVADDKSAKVEEQVEEIEKEKIKPSTSESNTSAPFSSDTLDVIDALIYGLPLPAMPLTAVSHEQVQDECLLRDSQLPTTLPSKANVLSDDAKTPSRRSRIPSKILQSPYLSNFGSSEKGKENLSDVTHQTHPFEGFGICYQPPSELVTEYSEWIDKGLLKSHGNKNSKEDHYRSKCSSFGFERMDFVVAFPKDKNWFYLMSQPDRCWNDEHIDVIFYYLRKKSKMQLSNQYRYTTTNCIFKNYIEYAHTRYYHLPPNISTQEDMARATVTAHQERSVKNIIRGFSIPAGLPWHLVDEVYIPVNCDMDFHWVLAVVVLKERLIRVYDSSPRRRSSNPFQEIQKIAAMLPTYLQDSGFFDNNERTDWSSLDSYKDKSTSNMLEPHHPLAVEYVEGIAQQGSGSLDCGVFLAMFAEYLSDGISIPSTGLNTEFFRSRYAALLWRYGCQKAMDGYVSDNDDPKKPRRDISPNQGELIDVQ
ncbi:uncharacterized protein LOC129903514, partial [Solanum dulcamara]|uniref:uncharacterized protein LOC129903514 n=1 Tax=Solanum dulcamara TaxID=45834 RepID=UPI0024868CE0